MAWETELQIAVRADGRGSVTVLPCDETQPTVSNLYVNSDRTIANLTTVNSRPPERSV